ncbi:hypothetical protein MMC21_002773 [Puttea exsequens]|nr:hypothetical protein [Puttea exsequens]
MAFTFDATAASSLPEHCTPTSQYLVNFSSAFHSCIPTSSAFISLALGILSILSWLFAQLPQIYKNYQLKSASGLSIYFLAEWLLGDLAQLLGALLTHQASWQVVVAAYYCTVDVLMVWQYIWYSMRKTWKKEKILEYEGDTDGRHSRSREILVGVSPPDSNSRSERGPKDDQKDEMQAKDKPDKGQHNQTKSIKPTSSLNEKLASKPFSLTIKRPLSPPTLPTTHTVLLASLFGVALTTALPQHLYPLETPIPTPTSPTSSEYLGRIAAWLSTLLYLCSRLPQLYKNARRRSTAGLSPILFIAAFGGNFFYSASLLSNPLAWSNYPPYGGHGWAGAEGSDRRQWVASAAPFWLGAAGVLVLDAAVGVQFLTFGEGVKVEEQWRGRGRWARVRGWMRGWVPSPSPEGRVTGLVAGEEESLLGRRDGEGERYGAV